LRICLGLLIIALSFFLEQQQVPKLRAARVRNKDAQRFSCAYFAVFVYWPPLFGNRPEGRFSEGNLMLGRFEPAARYTVSDYPHSSNRRGRF
jgi:hypothetical protein